MKNNTENNFNTKSTNIINNKKSINNIKSNIEKENNKKKNFPNIEIFNNNSIKNYLNKDASRNNKKAIFKNKSFEYMKINKANNNNNFSSSISISNISDKSIYNNFHLRNNDINKQNKVMPHKLGLYHLLKLEAQKKEELLKNEKNTIFNPNEIPIITNCLFEDQPQSQCNSHSYSKKNLKKGHIFDFSNNKYRFNGKHKEKSNNLELKIIPTNFKESKKIQVNLTNE